MQLTVCNSFNYGRNKINLRSQQTICILYFLLLSLINLIKPSLLISYCSNAFSVRNLVVFSSGSLRVQFQILHEVQYFHKRAALAMTLPLLRSPLIQLSATVGTAHLAFGMETIYNTSSRQFLMFDAGISMKSLNCEGSIIL